MGNRENGKRKKDSVKTCSCNMFSFAAKFFVQKKSEQ